MKPERIRTFIFPFIIYAVVLSLASCGPVTREAVSQLDTPGHHTYAGLKLLDLGKYSDAQREFKMANQLNSNYSKAYTGLALVYTATGKFDSAADNLVEGSKTAQTNDEKLFVNVSRIRYFTANKAEQNWLESAKNQFHEATLIDADHAPAYYFMGLAYKEALEFNFANQMFTKVTELKTDYLAEAETQLKFIDMYIQAKPTTQAGKQIANVEKITRADAAALFVEELKIKELLSKPEVKTEEKTAGISEPVVTGGVLHPPVPPMANDIFDHPFKNDIEEVLKTGVRGLENDPNGNFKPGEIISRGEYALMLEGIIKLTGEKELATKYLKSKSSFRDVPVDMPYFNAIMSMTSRDIMKAKNIKTGEFAPLKPLSGLEAQIIIRKFKEKVDINK
ncbi:MAG: S-layer homology domain-containing protein [Smithella sp.]